MTTQTWVTPLTLTGRVIRLEPLTAQHAADLQAAASPDIFQYLMPPGEWSLSGFEAFVQKLITWPNRVAFAMVRQEDNRAIGTTSYLDIQPPHRGLEIGFTWISVAAQGTAVNPESKYLLLRHAFETLGAVRVQLKTDARNLHSQRAIEKLGAVKEGVLRNHFIMYDGYIRDSVIYSIIDVEWPEIKARLAARLGYVPGSDA